MALRNFRVTIRYAPDARGRDVPDFACIRMPAGDSHPEADLYAPRRPYEAGPLFHHRAIALARGEAQRRGLSPWSALQVTFTSTLPPVWQRERQSLRYLWRWWMQHEGSDVEMKLWCARKLVLLNGIKPDVEPGLTPWGA